MHVHSSRMKNYYDRETLFNHNDEYEIEDDDILEETYFEQQNTDID